MSVRVCGGADFGVESGGGGDIGKGEGGAGGLRGNCIQHLFKTDQTPMAL